MACLSDNIYPPGHEFAGKCAWVRAYGTEKEKRAMECIKERCLAYSLNPVDEIVFLTPFLIMEMNNLRWWFKYGREK